jgi:hypothetical protein
MKSINKIIGVAMVAVLAFGCTEEYDCQLSTPAKPNDVAQSEYLNSLDLLKNYTAGQFHLGAYLSSSDFLAKGLPYSILCNNFQVLEVGNDFTPVSVTNDNNELDFATLTKLVEETDEMGFTLYGGTLLANTNQRAGYLNTQIAPDTIWGNKQGFSFVVNDFEADGMGTTYPMTGNSAATVVDDPKGVSGKCLQVGNTATPANQSFPIFSVTLPDGIILGNCKSLILDFNGTSSTGLYGQGMRMGINDNAVKAYDSPSSFGCPGGDWGRGKITLEFATLALTEAEKALTTFTLSVGSATGAGNYYIDNIKIYYEIGEDDRIVPKTEQQKKDLLTAELTQWISGNVGTGIKAWNIVGEPLDASAGDANTFVWKDYLGETDYARTAVKIARESAVGALDLFVSATFDLDGNSLQKADDLLALIAAWEADGVTKIDGINALLHLNYSKDLATQQANETLVGQLIEKFAASGKQIRISDLKMTISNASGVALKSTEFTAADRLLAADYYTFVIKKYFSAIVADKQYGISLAQTMEIKDGSVVCPWNVNSNRTEVYIGIVDGLKQGVKKANNE